MNRIKTALAVLLSLSLCTVPVKLLAAQEIAGLPRPSGLGVQSLRPYVHVFIAYTIVIVVVLGWVISIARRLRDVEERLGE